MYFIKKIIGAILVGKFKGHSIQKVKYYSTSLKSANGGYNLCKFEIMDEGITPVVVPLIGFLEEYSRVTIASFMMIT